MTVPHLRPPVGEAGAMRSPGAQARPQEAR
jgi:hypothetical protein